MPGQSKVNGIWRTTTGLSVKVSGSWKTATGAFIKVGGQWRQWFASKIEDAFNRASTAGGLGTAESGQLWNALRGNWRIGGANTAISDDAASNYALSTINLGASDVNINMDVSGGVGAAFWVTDSGSWWGSYARHTSSSTSVTVCNGGYSTCGGSGCNPGNCCSGIGQSSETVCNGGGASCSGAGCQPSGCCSGVSYSGGGSFCSDYRTGQSSSSGCQGGCSSTQSGGGVSCSGSYQTGLSSGSSCCDGSGPQGGGQVCDRLYASSTAGYPSNCCGGYGTYQEDYQSGSTCAYRISSCTGRNCTPSGCCAGEPYILKNYFTGGVYYSDCWSGSDPVISQRTRYYCYTGFTQQLQYWNCYTSYVPIPTVTTWSGCWGYTSNPIVGSCATAFNTYITRGCFTTTNQVPATNYVSDLVIVSSVSGTVTTQTTVNLSNNNSAFTQVGSIFVSTTGNSITARAYSGSGQSGAVGAPATLTPSNPTKGTSVGILKAPSTGNQGSTADTFLATLNI